MTKSKKRLIILGILLLLAAAVLFYIFVWYVTLPKGEIHVGHHARKVYNAGGDMVYYKGKDLYLYGSDEPLIKDLHGGYVMFHENKLYIRDENKELCTYDTNGNLLNRLGKLPEKFSVCKCDGNLLIGAVADENGDVKMIAVDLENSLATKEIPFQKTTCGQVTILQCEPGIIFCKGGTGSKYVAGKEISSAYSSSGSMFLGTGGNHAAYTPDYHSPSINLIDINSGESTKIETSDECEGVMTYSHMDDEKLSVVICSSSKFFQVNNDFGGVPDLKYHDNDYYLSYSIDGKLLQKHKFAKFERVIYADSKKVMTVKKGKYTTYSAEDWKVTDEKKADEIKNGGKYTFEACGEYVFVFDDNTGECISKIEI